MSAIKIENLSKSFGEIQAVNGISLEINRGEMFGLVGPDGAGKTTTIRMLCGLTSPQSGSAEILDNNVVTAKRKSQSYIGYLSQRFSLYGDLTVDENIEFFADIHLVNDFKVRRDQLLEMMRLIKFRDRPAEKLSGGMKQKLALACSLIHKPEVLFLDEPTTGVDPVSRRDFWKILTQLQSEGMTILLTTPYLDEAEKCNRIGLMNRGELIAVGEPEKVMNSIGMSVLEIFTPEVRKTARLISTTLAIDSQAFGDRIDILCEDPEATLAKIRDLLISLDIQLTEFRIKTPSLENIFIHLVSKEEVA
jgi:ABC-2 type transport system ATP-binding protein